MLATALSRGITVTNTPGVLTEDTADMTMALILAVPPPSCRGGCRTERRQTRGRLVAHLDARPSHLGQATRHNRHGAIGQAVAAAPPRFGLQIHYHNRRRVPARIEEELTATYWRGLDQMLARMDIISVNCPHTPATFHLLSARRSSSIRPQAYIVKHRARGGHRRERAGAPDRLRRHRRRGLDVFEHEPAVSPKLVKLARIGKVVLLPHMGPQPLEGRIDMGKR